MHAEQWLEHFSVKSEVKNQLSTSAFPITQVTRSIIFSGSVFSASLNYYCPGSLCHLVCILPSQTAWFCASPPVPQPQSAEGCCVHGMHATIVVCLAPRRWSCIKQLSDKLLCVHPDWFLLITILLGWMLWVLSREELTTLLLLT